MILNISYIQNIFKGYYVKKIIFTLFMLLSSIHVISSQDIILSLPDLPVHSYLSENGEPTGTFIDMYKLMKRKYTKGSIILSGLFPFERSLKNVVEGRADIHLPIIRPENAEQLNLPYDFLPGKLGTAKFVLYTRADDKREINKNNIQNYKIEIRRSHARFFDFSFSEGDNLESIFMKLLNKRIDGVIGPHDIVDSIISKNKYKNIKRQLFKEFEVHFAIPKGSKGERIKTLLTDFVKEFIIDPEYIEINSRVNIPYDNWQPYKMDW